MKEAQYTINHRRWRFRFAELPADKHADTDYEAHEIRLDIREVDEDPPVALDTVIHEIVHAQCPWMREWLVASLARLLAKVIGDQFDVRHKA